MCSLPKWDTPFVRTTRDDGFLLLGTHLTHAHNIEVTMSGSSTLPGFFFFFSSLLSIACYSHVTAR